MFFTLIRACQWVCFMSSSLCRLWFSNSNFNRIRASRSVLTVFEHSASFRRLKPLIDHVDTILFCGGKGARSKNVLPLFKRHYSFCLLLFLFLFFQLEKISGWWFFLSRYSSITSTLPFAFCHSICPPWVSCIVLFKLKRRVFKVNDLCHSCSNQLMRK